MTIAEVKVGSLFMPPVAEPSTAHAAARNHHRAAPTRAAPWATSRPRQPARRLGIRRGLGGEIQYFQRLRHSNLTFSHQLLAQVSSIPDSGCFSALDTHETRLPSRNLKRDFGLNVSNEILAIIIKHVYTLGIGFVWKIHVGNNISRKSKLFDTYQPLIKVGNHRIK